MNNKVGNQRNKQNQNKETKNFYCRVIKDYYNKLFEKVIQLYGKHEYKERKAENLCSFSEFTKEERKGFLSYIGDISNYNDDFNKVTNEFLFDPKSEVSRDKLVIEIKNVENKYYLDKAKFVWKIKLFLIILQYIYIFFLDFKHNCVDNLKEAKDEKFWHCEDKKCKVELIFFDWDKILRVIYLFLFDMIYLLNQFDFLRNFDRKVLGDYNAQFYQCFEYLLIILIYSYDFFNEKICVESRIKNIFYKKKIFSLDLILLFIDIIKFIIK